MLSSYYFIYDAYMSAITKHVNLNIIAKYDSDDRTDFVVCV